MSETKTTENGDAGQTLAPVSLLGDERRRLTAIILSGFCANPAVFAANGMSGWGLVNCKDEDIVGYSMSLANKIIECEKAHAAVT